MEEKIIFQKLTPVDTVDMAVYEDAFKYIFENTDIKNVAIAGPYSAGKSSLLESYKKNATKKFLHISLAHFQKSQNPKSEESDNDIQTVLEGKILNQLLQQIGEKNIPQTKFHIKRTVNNGKCILFAVLTSVFALCVLHLKYFENWSYWIETLSDSWIKTVLKVFSNPYSMLGSGLVAVVIMCLGIYHLLKAQKNKNILRKLSVQGNEIEIFGDDDNSYFDKYLNEVLYIFENVGVDVIVFEDLDRFDNNKVFERLREINTLANIRLQNKKKACKPLRFFYLLRDDIFVSKDRTKFFDYILPVVPVIDSSNSYDQIRQHFERSGVFHAFDDKFLRGLALYIDDMRVLKNIYNEFTVYFNKLNTIELSPNKMLAMITYKNIFPRDFSDLQLNRGFVNELFKKKSELTSQEKERYEAEIKNKEAQIEAINREFLKSITELDDVKEGRSKRISPYSGTLRNTQLNQYNEWVEKEYPVRKKAIEDKNSNRLKELEEEVALLKEAYHTVENRNLHEIITRENIDEFFKISSVNEVGDINEYDEIKASEYFLLLKFLIRTGYIDETYNDYMTYFYENSLTKEDKMYLRSVMDKKAKPFSYALKNAELVMANLDISDFEQEETLNFDLFEYLLQNETKRDILLRFMKQVEKEGRFQFISEFFDTKRERKNLIVELNTQWPQFFENVLSGQKMTTQQIKDLSVDMITYLDNTTLNNVNIEGCLAAYISNQPDYLAIENINVTKLSDAMSHLGVSFVSIDYEKSNKELFDEIYHNSLYEINIDNISLMLQREYHYENVDETLQQCISTVYSQPEQALYKYIQLNKNLFMETILQLPIDKFTDKDKYVVFILNDGEIVEENKIAYIERLETKISNLAEVEETIYKTELIARMLVKYTTENILEYFSKMGLTDNLVEFINTGDCAIDYGEVANKDLVEQFWKQCISNETLSLQKYVEIIRSIGPKYSEFEIAGIPSKKLKVLIQWNIIPMTENTLQFIRDNYEEDKMQYIEHNLAEYVSVSTGNLASVEEVEEILTWRDVSNELKIEALAGIKEKISVAKSGYSDEIISYILKNNLDESDLPILFRDYNTYGSKAQKEIIAIAKNYIIKMINEFDDVSTELMQALLSDTSISIDKRVDLYVAFIGGLTDEECHNCLRALEFYEIAKVFEENKRPRISINPTSRKIMNVLKQSEFINSYVEDPENNVFKKVRRSAK